jgi:hypothetical protein
MKCKAQRSYSIPQPPEVNVPKNGLQSTKRMKKERSGHLPTPPSEAPTSGNGHLSDSTRTKTKRSIVWVGGAALVRTNDTRSRGWLRRRKQEELADGFERRNLEDKA